MSSILTTDPKFVNASTNDFHLQSTSPAINAGATIASVTTDKDGVTRPQGSAYDIGAYEYVSGGGGDTTPPSTPTNLTATAVSSSQINLSWTASTDNVAVTGYKVFRGGTQIATTPTSSYSNTGLSPSTAYTYTVQAYDAANNVSAQSSQASATTQAGTPTPTLIPQNTLTVASVDSQETGYEATKAIDANSTTMWHTQFVSANPPPPHWIILNLNGTYSVKGFRYLPRSDGYAEGTIKDYQFATSMDNITYATPTTGTFASDTTQKDVVIPGTTAKYVKLTAMSEINGNPWTHAAELNIFGDPVSSGTGPLALYTFDNTPNDTSGNSYNGTLINSPTYVAGKIGQAIQFNGTSQYMTNATFPWTTGPATVAFWVKTPGGTQGGAFGVGGQTNPNRFGSHAPYSDNTLYFDYGDIAGTGRVSVDFTPYLNQWTHVALVSGGNGGTFKGIYLNGTLASSGTTSDGPNISLTGIDIGRWNLAGTSYYQTGAIDDFRLYNRALSASEVQALYTAGGATDTISPTTPTNLTATPVSTSQINLSWTASTDNVGVVGYKVFRDGTQIATPAATTYSDMGLTASTMYTYILAAYDAAGNNSNASTPVSATTQTPADTTPPTLSAIQSSGITQTGATITWTSNEPATTQIDYGLTTAYGQSTTLNTSLVTSHSQSLGSLSANTTYHYRVRSKDAANNEAVSTDNTFTTTVSTDTTAPSAITNLSTNEVRRTSVDLWWTAPGDDGNAGTATSYDVRYSTSPITAANFSSATQASNEPTPSANGITQTYTLSGLTANTTYYVALKTSDEVPNTSLISNVITFKTTNKGKP
jgi:chitodextrinase